MRTDKSNRAPRSFAIPLLIAALSVAVIVCAMIFTNQLKAADSDLKPSGTIVIDATQVAFLFSGQGGGGTLNFKGQSYPFTIRGLGVGGIGISKLKATGTVYNMTSIDQFEGAYGQARTGYALGDTGSGKLWLEKTSGGVVIKLVGEREGLALSLGADVINIKLK